MQTCFLKLFVWLQMNSYECMGKKMIKRST